MSLNEEQSKNREEYLFRFGELFRDLEDVDNQIWNQICSIFQNNKMEDYSIETIQKLNIILKNHINQKTKTQHDIESLLSK